MDDVATATSPLSTIKHNFKFPPSINKNEGDWGRDTDIDAT